MASSPLKEWKARQELSPRKTPNYGGAMGLSKGSPTTAESPSRLEFNTIKLSPTSARKRSSRHNLASMAHQLEFKPRTPSAVLAPAPTYGRSISTSRKERLANVALDKTAEAQAEWNDKTWVWIEENDGSFLAAWIVDESKARDMMVQVCTKDDQIRTVSQQSISKMNPPKFDRVDDIADLTFLNEASVVHNINMRYQSDLIYTYSGLFLVAVNPYKSLPIYGDTVVSTYRNKRRGDRPPHVFAIADAAYSAMMASRASQSILVTGESGAGKTENTKKVIQYLASVAGDAEPLQHQQESLVRTIRRSSRTVGQLERQILQANPILEAFGNAQTVRNNNSSRFGKFIRIEFDQAGQISGAHIDWYLLEKSRVVARSEQERSFHIFYQLLSGASKLQRQDLLLDELTHRDFLYLSSSRVSLEGVNDARDFSEVMCAFDVVGFSDREQDDIFRVVAAILHIGNVGINEDRSGKAYLAPGPSGQSQLAKVARLIGVDVGEIEKAFFAPCLKAGREWVTQSRNKAQVTNEMAALCKALYERLFGALVAKMNQSMSRTTGGQSKFIGVLDIAGFEIFDVNSFEQLCINYTNERLQQFFNYHMFILEQEEYARENISWDYVNFGLDLQPTIELIESNSPIGVLSCLDEESIMPKATDATFTQKLHALWKGKSDKYPVPKPINASTNFIIKHYAGAVEYNTTGWLDKNKDPLNDHVTRTLATSSSSYIASLFADYADCQEDPYAPKKRRKGAFRTVAQRHREQLASLMSQLGSTEPHFVRCILPNQAKSPGKIDSILVLDQLKCNGVLEGIRIARLGYPNRLPFSEFRQRYELVAKGAIPAGGYIDSREAALRIIKSLDLDTAACKLGTSKIFFKAGVLAELEECREARLGEIFTIVNAYSRRYLSRRKIRKILERDTAVRLIQRNVRAYNLVKESPWFQLFAKVRPTLNASRADEELRQKAEEIERLEAQAAAQAATQQDIEAQRIRLEAEKQSIEAELEAERALIEQKDAVLRRTKDREAALEEEIARLSKTIQDVRSCERDAVTTRRLLEAEHSTLKSACDRLTSELSNTESALRDCEARIVHQNIEIKLARQREAEANAKAISTEELDRVKAQLEEEKSRSSQRQIQLQKWGDNLLQKLQNVEKERDQLIAELALLEQRQKQNAVSMSNLSRAKADNDASLKSLETQVKTLKDRLLARDQDLSTMESGKRALIAKVSQLEIELNSARQEFVRSSEDKRTAVQQLAILQRTIQENASQQDQQKSIIKQLQDEREIYRTRVASMENEKAKAREHDVSEVRRLGQELQAAKREAQKASEELEDRTAALNTAQLEMREIAERVLDAQDETEAVRDEFRKFQAQYDSNMARYAQFEQGRQANENKLRELQSKATASEEAYSALEKEHRRMQSKLKVQQLNETNLVTRIKGMEAKISELDAQLSSTMQENKRLSKNGERLRTELADKVAQLDQIPQNVIEHVHVLKEAKRVQDKELSQAKTKITELESSLLCLEKVKQQMKQEMEDYIHDLQKQRSMSNADESANRQLSEDIQFLQSNLVKANTDRQILQDTHDRLIQSITSLQKDLVEKERMQTRAHDTAIEELTMKLRASEESRARLERQISRTQQDKENIAADENVRHRMLEEMQAVNASLTREMEDILRVSASKTQTPLSSPRKRTSLGQNAIASPNRLAYA